MENAIMVAAAMIGVGIIMGLAAVGAALGDAQDGLPCGGCALQFPSPWK